MPHEEQLADEQLPQPDAADDVVWTCPPGPDVFEMNPQADISLARSSLLQWGHWGIMLPMTSVSKFFSHWLHLYSYIGMLNTFLMSHICKQD